MKIAAVCVTYLRPRELGHLIQAFLDQDYSGPRELLILDDAGQYDDQAGEDWRLVSVGQRVPTLGEKRNAAIGLCSPEAEAFCVWDDDDYYLPWAIRATAAALRWAEWSVPSQVLIERPHGSGVLHRHETGGLFHGGHAYTRAAFDRAGGYPAMNNGEDQTFFDRLRAAGASQVDPLALGFDPFYIYDWHGPGYHLSGLGPRGYESLGKAAGVVEKTELVIAHPPGLSRPQIQPAINPRPF